MIETIKKKWPTFCINPYKFLDIRRNPQDGGKLEYPCCCNLDMRFDDANDVEFKNIKEQQLNGQWPDACWRCQHEENSGIVSERLRMLMMSAAEEIESLASGKPVDEFMVKIVFSNSCQLACRSCTPDASSTFAKITNDLETTRILEHDIVDDHFDHIKDIILQRLSSDDDIMIHIIGGEGMTQPGAIKLLDWGIEAGISSRIRIVFTTSLVVPFNEKWQFYHRHYKGTVLNCSIDSVGENYQYVRWPVKFEKIDNNLKGLVGIENLGVCVTPVFSLNNIFYINDYLDYWLNFFQETNVNWIINPLSLIERTVHLDVDALPKHYHQHLLDLLTQCLDHELFKKYYQQTFYFNEWIKSIILKIENLNESSDVTVAMLWNRYLRFTAYFDIRTKSEASVYNKKFFDILLNEDKENLEKLKKSLNTSRPLPMVIYEKENLFNEAKIH